MKQFLPTTTLNMIEGFVDAEEGDRLARYAARVPSEQAIVEIGSASGSGALYLAAGAREGNGAHVYAVDLWDMPVERNRPEAYARPEVLALFLARIDYLSLRDAITAVKSDSVEAGKRYTGAPVGLLHLDGDHRLEALQADYAAWEPHLAPGAVLIVHDVNAKHEGLAGDFTRGLAGWREIERPKWSRHPKRRGQWIGVKA